MSNLNFSIGGTLLDDAKYHLEKGKKSRNPYELRLATHAIVDYYKKSLNMAGSYLGIEMPESADPIRKFSMILLKTQKILKWKPLIYLAWHVRNKVDHTDTEAPKIMELKHLIEKAQEFEIDLKEIIEKKKILKKQKLTLREEIKENIDKVNFYLKLNESVGYDKKLNQHKKALREIKKLYPKGQLLRMTLSAVNESLKAMSNELERLYELAYRICPKCDGDIVSKTEETTQYSGPYDDPEPVSFSVFHVLKCERCGHEIEREHITTEPI